MEYRVTADELRQTLASWDALFPGRGKIRLVACGGTALSLLGYKESTLEHEAVSLGAFEKRYRATAGYEISEERVIKNLEHFLTKARGKKT